jgi:hypothetical protein
MNKKIKFHEGTSSKQHEGTSSKPQAQGEQGASHKPAGVGPAHKRVAVRRYVTLTRYS